MRVAGHGSPIYLPLPPNRPPIISRVKSFPERGKWRRKTRTRPTDDVRSFFSLYVNHDSRARLSQIADREEIGGGVKIENFIEKTRG